MAVKKLNSSIKKFIQKGAATKPAKDNESTKILVLIPNSLLEEIDSLVKEKPWLNRTRWIVQALHEKVDSSCQ